jgi:hypothetical protein
MTDGTGTGAISPLTLVHGVNTPTITSSGTFTIVLPDGVVGTAETGGWVVTASPKALVAGSNTIIVEAGGAGTITVTLSTVGILIPGHVMDHFPGKSHWADHGWLITLGPVIASDAQIASLGSLSKLIWEYIQLDVWVMEKRDLAYAAETTRGDLVQEVDRCLLHYSAAPGTGYMHVNASGWQEIDETGMKRSSMTTAILYGKVRT